MREPSQRDLRSELISRGFSRRSFAKWSALLAAGASLPFYNESALAQDLKAIGAIPPDAVKINANENPMGPCPAAIEAMRAVVSQGGRYLFHHTFDFVDAMAQSEDVPSTHVLPFAGSSDPLHRAVLAFTSPTRPLITADPGYEAPAKAAAFIGAKVIQIPLRKDGSHDVAAMVKADPNAGVIYICNPNNPTGGVTRREDVDHILANKPDGCLLVLDEAYIQFSTTATPATDLVASDKDVIALRTFSKLYGMAGLRAGAALGRPDLLDKLKSYGGLGIMPATGMVGATASLKNKGLVAQRRRIVAEIREDLCGWLAKKGHGFLPSEANMLMVDCKRPGKEAIDALLTHKVAVGRVWPSLPNHVRVTIGTREEMAKFKTAFDRVMNA